MPPAPYRRLPSAIGEMLSLHAAADLVQHVLFDTRRTYGNQLSQWWPPVAACAGAPVAPGAAARIPGSRPWQRRIAAIQSRAFGRNASRRHAIPGAISVVGVLERQPARHHDAAVARDGSAHGVVLRQPLHVSEPL